MSEAVSSGGLFASEYRGFVEPERITPLGSGELMLQSVRGRSLTVSPLDLEVARLFDGSRNADAIVAMAKAQLALTIDPLRLEGLVSDLACAGLMRPGRLDPLPVTPHVTAEVRALGWKDTPSTMVRLPADHALPPSTVAGTLTAPGYLGSVLGLVGVRAEPNRMLVEWPAAPFERAGRALLWPVMGRIPAWSFGFFFLACLFAIATHRHAWVLGGLSLIRGWGWIAPLVTALVLQNVFDTAARAAAVARYTPGQVRVGLLRSGVWGLPRLFVDTAGAAESADRATRLRIIATGLVTPAALAILAIVTWFLFHGTAHTLADFAITVACVGIVTLVWRLNPVGEHEGYLLLAHGLGHPDLRMQGLVALVGLSQPWPTARAELSRGSLIAFLCLSLIYAIGAVALLVLFVGGWLSDRFGGIGMIWVLSVVGLLIWRRWRRADGARDNLGRPQTSFKFTRRMGIAIGVAIVVALIPYHVEPSGPFTVLPSMRADVVAKQAGDVRLISAVEGQQVEAGQVIATIDDAEAASSLAVSQARVDALTAEIALLRQGARTEAVALARQKVETAQARVHAADSEARRVTVAWRRGGDSAIHRDLAQGAADVARAQRESARSDLELVTSGARADHVEAAEAELKGAVVERDDRQRRFDETKIRAPIAGRVVAPDLRYSRGRYLAAGSVVAQVENVAPRIAEVQMREADAKRLVADRDATIRPWAHTIGGLSGRVVHVAPSAEAGEGGRIVRVQIEFTDPEDRLKSGMTGMAKIDGGWEPVIVVFTRALARYFFVRSWSWIP